MNKQSEGGRFLALVAFVALALVMAGCGSPRPRRAADAGADAGSRAAAVRHVLDVRELRETLDALSLDERPEQLLDLAVVGTLVAEGVDASVLRDALHDAPLLRHEGRSDLLAQESSAGRRVHLPGGRAALFAFALDPAWRVTYGRLADKVRAELGEKPARVELWRAMSVAGRDQIVVERLDGYSVEALFSSDFGYHEQRVTTAAELGRFLAAVDDLTYARSENWGGTLGVTLGGRRGVSQTHPRADLSQVRVDLDDVATLYRVNLEMLPRVEPVLDLEEIPPTVDRRFDGLVSRYNDAVHAGGVPAADFDEDARWLGFVLRVEVPASHATLTEQRATLDRLESRIQPSRAERRRLAEESLATVRRDRLATQPGFSLDPQFHAERVLAALDRVVADPAGVAREARAADASRGPRDPVNEGGPAPALAARQLAAALPPDADERLADEIARLAGRIRRARGEVAAGARDPDEVSRAVHDLERNLAGSGNPASLLVRYALAREHVQCARYDGQALQGSRAGATFFYCDVLAKLWGTIEHPAHPPVESVVGFQSAVLGRNLAAGERGRADTSTRVWFGPRPDAAARLPAWRGVLFEPWFTRIFAASRDPTQRSEDGVPAEGVPAEPERRMVDWWNRNLARIADFEPQYHRQNELLKWSTTTAWLVRHRLLRDLAGVPHQPIGFGDWLRAAGPTLRGARGIEVLPRARWAGATECLDVLTSRVDSHQEGEGARSGWIEGGVNGGGPLTLRDMREPAAGAAAPRRAGAEPEPGPRRSWRIRARALRVETERATDGEERASVQVDDEHRAPLAAAGRPTRVDTAVRELPPEPAAPGVKRVALSQRDDRGDLLALVATRNADGSVKYALPDKVDIRAHPPTGPPIARHSTGADGFARNIEEVRALASAGGEGGPPTDPPGELLAGFYEGSRRNPGGARAHYDRAVHGWLPEHAYALPAFERAAREYGEEAGEYVRIQLGHADVAPGDRGRFSLTPNGPHLSVTFALDPSAPVEQTTADEIFNQYQAARRGGRTDVYPEVLVDQARLAHRFDFVAHPLESVTALHRGGRATVSKVNVGLTVGTANFTLAQRGNVRYVRVLGRAPAAASSQRTIYLVDARGGAN